MHGQPQTQQARARSTRTRTAARLGRRGSLRWLLVSGLLGSALASCSSGSHVRIADSTHVDSPSATVTSPSPTPSVRDQVLSQYRAFWAHLTPASLAPASQRRGILSPYTDEPELTSLIRGMAKQDGLGEAIYGENIPHPKVSRLSVPQGLAVISDCQDSSHSGIERRSTHKRLTVGVKANTVVVTMRLGADGTWRVSFVSYPTTSC